jgi:hypothetical protein
LKGFYIMNTRRVFALLVICVLGMGLAGPGCATGSPCSDVENTVRIIDNRDGKYPDHPDWICITMSGGDYTPPEPPPPPPPPDVSVVSPPDPPGPRDSDAVLNAAIAYVSCNIDPQTKDVNNLIGGIYNAKLFRTVPAALAERTSCFKDMANGCEAYRKCMGIGTSMDAPMDTPHCKDGIAFDLGWKGNELVHMWTNCTALGYDCYATHPFATYGECVYPNRKDCDDSTPDSQCIDGIYHNCFSDSVSPTFWSIYDFPKCSTYGLECAVTTGPGAGWYYCTANGPACDYNPSLSEEAVFEYRNSISCENNNVLRTCVGSGELLLDCSSLNPKFQCLSAEGPYRAQCGIARECSEYDKPTCDGTSLVVCDAGEIRKVDCTSLGFDSCNAELAICN